MPTPALGLGLGWRPETAGLALERNDLGFVEVISESVPLDSALPLGLLLLREQGTTVIPHGVSLGLGGGARPSMPRLERMAAVAERLGSPLVSDHIAFVRAGGLNAGHLMPLPRTRASLDVLVANVRAAQSVLPVPLALEPIASLMAWPHPPSQEIDEADFLCELVDRTGCRLLLDLANLHTNARNHRFDPVQMLDRLPLESLAYVHVAGGEEHAGLWHDTHAAPIWPEVTELISELAARVEIPGIMLERDDAYPAMDELSAELDVIATAWREGNGRFTGQRPTRARTAVRGASEPSDEQRLALEEVQRQLLAALVADGQIPAGFVEHRVATTRSSLQHKRLHEARRAAPALAACLGESFGVLFAEWANRVPPRGTPPGDARAFARALPAGRLSRAAALELVVGEARALRRPGIRTLRGVAGGHTVRAARLPGGRIAVTGGR